MDAINDTARFGRTRIVRKITGHVKLKPTYVRERVHIRLAKGADLRATLTAKDKDRSTLLARYGAKQVYKTGRGSKTASGKRRPGGVSVHVLADGPRKTLTNAFFVTLKSNGIRGVAYRERNADGTPTNRRYGSKGGKQGSLAIDVLYGPGIYRQMQFMLPELAVTLSQKLLAEATRQYQRRLPK